jgi:antitoxin VapB
MARSTIFKNNGAQTVRIPKSLALPKTVHHVEVTKAGCGLLIMPAYRSWDAFFDGPRVSSDFMAARRNGRRNAEV